MMACDILSIPITTVASESAFSAGGRVIEPHRTSLGADTVQMLMCGADWFRAHYSAKKNKQVSYFFIKIYICFHYKRKVNMFEAIIIILYLFSG